jgi:hypothetical protein
MAWYVGILRADGRRFRVRRVEQGRESADQAILLGAIWWHAFKRNTLAMAEQLLSADWLLIENEVSLLSPAEVKNGRAHLVIVPGVGIALQESNASNIMSGDLEAREPNEPRRMFLLDGVGRARLFLYEADSHWRLTASWRLRDLQQRPSDSPADETRPD